MRRVTMLSLLLLPGMLVALYMAFLYAPTEAFMGEVQRVFYFHVGSAWTAYAAFTVVLVGGLLYLKTRAPHWDRLAAAGAEMGVLFTTITLLSGSIWARVVWGWWWTWEPRLTTTLVMWFMYLAYLLLRRAVDEPGRRARVASVFGILAFFNVPVVHLSVQWWRSLHPFTVGPGRMELHPAMLTAMLVAVAVFTLLGTVLVLQRYRVLMLEDAIAGLAAGRLTGEDG